MSDRDTSTTVTVVAGGQAVTVTVAPGVTTGPPTSPAGRSDDPSIGPDGIRREQQR